MDDVTLVPLGVGPAAVAAVQAKQVDALIYHDTFYPFLEKNDIHVTFYKSPMLDRPFAGQGIFGMENYIQRKKDLVTAFLRGLTKSLAYSTNDPAAATTAFAEMHPEIGKQLDLEEAAWRERIKITFPIDGKWGVMNDEMWNNLDDLLLQGKVITEKPEIEKLYTTDFVAAANEKTK
jgi:ABC-type nitrate/sulfonate/bicarbonate transport system substrate-binding protein